MARKRNLRNLGRRGLSLFLALVMCTSLIQISAVAVEDYKVGDTFQADSADAELPANIPEGTYWSDPEEAPDTTKDPICGGEEHTHGDGCTSQEISAEAYTEENPDQYKVEQSTYYKLICEKGDEEAHTHGRDCYGERYYSWSYDNFPERPDDGQTTTVDGVQYMYKIGRKSSGWYRLTCDKAESQGHTHSLEADCYTIESASAEDNDLTLSDGFQYFQYDCTAHEHTNECYPLIYTWTLKAYEVESVEIVDDIINSGCLVAQVTGRAVSYQWYKNGEPMEGETNPALYVAVHDSANGDVGNNSRAKDDRPTYKVVVSDGTNTKEDSLKLPYYTALQNGSFEYPNVQGLDSKSSTVYNGWTGVYQIKSGSNGVIWKTTGLDPYGTNKRDIELVRPGMQNNTTHGTRSAKEGYQFAEVNAEAYGALYQDVMTQPGSTLHWSFAHRGRNGQDTLALVIVNADGSIDVSDFDDVPQEYIQATVKDGNSSWKTYQGTYKVPAGQFVTRFYFVAVKATGGATQGNLLDDITFSSTAPVVPQTYGYTINYHVDGAKVETESGRAEAGATVLPSYLELYESKYDSAADYSESKIEVTAAGPNVLDLYFTTPEYAIEYYVKGETDTDYSKVTDSTVLAGLTTSGKLAYGSSKTISGLGLPDTLTVGSATYAYKHSDPDGNFTMTKGGENVIKVYYAYQAPDYKTIRYAWTNDSTLPANTSKTIGSDEDILDLTGYTPDRDVPTFDNTARYTYTTSGWYIDPEHNIPYTNQSLNDGDTLYAYCLRSDVNSYSIQYNFADFDETTGGTIDGSGALLPSGQNNLTLDQLQAITLTTLTDLERGYTFEGWYRDAAHTQAIDSLASEEASLTVYAYLTYVEPAPIQHPYTVVYEYHDIVDGRENIGQGASSPRITAETGTVTQAAHAGLLDTKYSAAPATLAEYNIDNADEFTKGTGAGDKAIEGSWGSGLTYVIHYYRQTWTSGSLQIIKNITGLDETSQAALEAALTFTVTGPNDYSRTIAYSELTETVNGNPALTINDLEAGTYTVTENNATTGTDSYTLTASASMDKDGASENGYQVEVNLNGVTAAITITNAYQGKTYNIFFDGGDHGKVNYNYTSAYGIDRVRLQEFEADKDKGEEEPRYGWGGGFREVGQTLYGLNNGETIYPNLASNPTIAEGTRQVMYTFTYAQYLDHEAVMEIPAPGLTVDDGYDSNKSFYHGDTAFTGIEAAMEAMNSTDPDENGFYNITYTAQYTANQNTRYKVNYYYQNADGTYPLTPHDTAIRTGTTGAAVSVDDADKTPNGSLGLAGLTYVYDANNASNVSSGSIAGNELTTLKVYFKWQKGVSYNYVASSGTLPSEISVSTGSYAITDTASYSWGDTTANNGKVSFPENATTYSVPGGVWTLSSWNGDHRPMANAITGVTYTGTWTYTANGSATVTLNFVDEQGNQLLDPVSQTKPHGSSYDFASAIANTDTLVTSDGLTYTFTKDYEGAFDAGREDQDVAYTGAIPSGGKTLTRVYALEKQNVVVTKKYDIDSLPAGFAITVTDKTTGAAAATLNLDNAASNENRTAAWNVQLPTGHAYTFTETGYSNGDNWTTALTARWENQATNVERAWNSLTVTNFSFDLPKVDKNTLAVELTNAYTYTPPAPASVGYDVVHVYYTNNSRDGQTSVSASGSDGATITADNITKAYTYGGFTYNFTSASPASITLDKDGERLTITLRYDRTVGGDDDDDDDDDPVTVPDPDVPTTDLPDGETPTTDLPDGETPTANLPEEEVPTTDLPEEEVPLAEAPATGDSLILWVMAAAASGAGLVWLALSGRKRKEDDAQ